MRLALTLLRKKMPNGNIWTGYVGNGCILHAYQRLIIRVKINVKDISKMQYLVLQMFTFGYNVNAKTLLIFSLY